jgi:hypothetical protein
MDFPLTKSAPKRQAVSQPILSSKEMGFLDMSMAAFQGSQEEEHFNFL